MISINVNRKTEIVSVYFEETTYEYNNMESRDETRLWIKTGLDKHR